MAVASVSRLGRRRRTSGASRSGCGRTRTLREPLDRLKCERALALQVLRGGVRGAASSSAWRDLGLRESALRPRAACRSISAAARADLFVRALEQLGQRQLDMRRRCARFRPAARCARLVEERGERLLVEPARAPRVALRRPAASSGGLGRREVAKQRRLAQLGLAPCGQSRQRRAARGSPARAHPRRARGRSRSRAGCSCWSE